MRPPLGALPSVKLKLEKTLKVWAEAAVTSNVSASRLRASFTQNLLWVSKKQHRFYIHFSFFIAIDLFVMLRKSDGFPKLHGLFRRRQILEVGFRCNGQSVWDNSLRLEYEWDAGWTRQFQSADPHYVALWKARTLRLMRGPIPSIAHQAVRNASGGDVTGPAFISDRCFPFQVVLRLSLTRNCAKTGRNPAGQIKGRATRLA